MRLIVCGGREFADRRTVYSHLDYMHAVQNYGEGPRIVAIIEGGAKGADRFARDWANENNVPVETFPADWEQHGRAAGPIRNQQMLKEGNPDALLAFAGGKGTRHMVTIARNAGLEVTRIT